MVAHRLAHRGSDDGIRPFLIQRDLAQLASLIELAFRPELDRTGNQIAAEMRRLARAGPLLWLLGASQTLLPALMGGHVWIADGQLIGNVTLSQESGRRGLWSISNVAVHPSFRGRGIARQLMRVTLKEADEKGAELIILEVGADNVAAQRLYRELGFEVYDTIAELSLPAHNWPRQLTLPALPLRKRRPDDRQRLYHLSRAATPAKAQEIRPIPVDRYRMGIGRRVMQWLDNVLYLRQIGDWVLEENSQIVALLQLSAQYRHAAHRLRITVHPEHRGAIEAELVAAALYKLNHCPVREITATVSTSHAEARNALHNAGFRTIRILDQMRFDPRRAREGTTR